jgi:broad specificity phosphatase PhoE
MTTRLTFLCSGATEANRKGAFPLDEPLEPKAAEAAAVLAGRLRRAERVLTSPLVRATQTAKAFALASEPVETLRDQDFGRWAGRRISVVQQLEPEALATWLNDPEAAPHGGESLAEMAARVVPLLDELMALKGHTVAVTHPAVIRLAVVSVLGAPIPAFWKIDVEPLSITELTGDGRRWALRISGRNS